MFTFVAALLACMAPKDVLHNIFVVQLKFVVELHVVSFALIEKSL